MWVLQKAQGRQWEVISSAKDTCKAYLPRWWLVDPSNRPFFSAGLDSVYPDSDENFAAHFPEVVVPN